MRLSVSALIATILVAFAVAAAFRSEMYRLCLSMELCDYPSLKGVEIRMRPHWMPETYRTNGLDLLSFQENGKALAAGGRVMKFQIDPAAAKALSSAFAVREFFWGRASVGTLSGLESASSNSPPVHYLVVPELSVVAVSTDKEAFDDIVVLREEVR